MFDGFDDLKAEVRHLLILQMATAEGELQKNAAWYMRLGDPQSYHTELLHRVMLESRIKVQVLQDLAEQMGYDRHALLDNAREFESLHRDF